MKIRFLFLLAVLAATGAFAQTHYEYTRLYEIGSPGQFNAPSSICIDGNGRILIGDNTQRVFVFDSTGQFLFQFGSQGSGIGQFTYISGIGFDGWNNIYVSSDTRVQKFDPSGGYLQVFNEPSGYYVGAPMLTASGFILSIGAQANPFQYYYLSFNPNTGGVYENPINLTWGGLGGGALLDDGSLIFGSGGPESYAYSISSSGGLSYMPLLQNITCFPTLNGVGQSHYPVNYAYCQQANLLAELWNTQCINVYDRNGSDIYECLGTFHPADQYYSVDSTLTNPNDLAIDNQKRLYVTDRTANKVIVYGPHLAPTAPADPPYILREGVLSGTDWIEIHIPEFEHLSTGFELFRMDGNSACNQSEKESTGIFRAENLDKGIYIARICSGTDCRNIKVAVGVTN